jgi:four helix bundle protein
MSRDHRKLKVFEIAHKLVIDVYSVTVAMPKEERYGLQSQIRRAAVSVSTNIVEGCARRTPREFLQFLNIALGSASEARYLIDLVGEIGQLDGELTQPIAERYGDVIRGLQGLIRVIGTEARGAEDCGLKAGD